MCGYSRGIRSPTLRRTFQKYAISYSFMLGFVRLEKIRNRVLSGKYEGT